MDHVCKHAPVNVNTINFVSEITKEMVEAGMVDEHVPMVLHQSLADELLGHSTDKVQP